MQKLSDKIKELIGVIAEIRSQGKRLPDDLVEEIESFCSDAEDYVNHVKDHRYVVQAVRIEGS